MSFKEKVQKALLEIGAGEDWKDLKENLLKSIKLDTDKIKSDADTAMNNYFDNLEKKIKGVVIEVIKENPDILKEK